MDSQITIRKAELKDISEVFAMLQELSAFEKLPQNVKISKETFEKDFIEKAFTSFVAERSDGKLVGYTVSCQAYSTWEGRVMSLRDIYVKPELRGTGIGRKLFITTMKDGYKAGCNSAFFLVLDWNPAVKFYKELGATDITEKENYHIFKVLTDDFVKLCTSTE
ncbi:unnamed protein product [Phyllotreta striolata]|uniref:N-acetyltransferase domain-containing protein n=1 Tax=Phyllotreta striolata TaxID=444603 RepID=A0A9N9TE00_PHYSR|nr:unnamed protein product [Phyllotreta striolata]